MKPKEEKENKRKVLVTKLKSKYRLVVLNDDSFEEKFSFRLSPLNVFVAVGITLIILITLVISLIAFTSLREFIPGYADVNLRRNALQAVLKADSLDRQLKIKDKYLLNISNILEGKIVNDTIAGKPDTTRNYAAIQIKKNREDSLLRLQIESEDMYKLVDDKMRKKGISGYYFFTPVNGTITSSFDTGEHFGIDIVAPENESVKATLNGTVIFASWTTENGYVMQIQHENNIVSCYKHNAVLLKKAGDYVNAGDVIAIIGNSGELTTGPHLHFELWHNGIPVNPTDYIAF